MDNQSQERPIETSRNESQSAGVVFRVQDADGRGPWKPGFSHRWVEDRPDHENLIPWFNEFGDVRERAIYGMVMGCGCRTLDQLRRWFTPSEYKTLLGFGYQAVKMQIGRVLAESDIQCVFECSKPLNQGCEVVQLYAPEPSVWTYERLKCRWSMQASDSTRPTCPIPTPRSGNSRDDKSERFCSA